MQANTGTAYSLDDLYGVFKDYAPHPLPEGGYGLTRWQGFSGRTLKYCLRDAVNGNLGKPTYKLVEYRIGSEKIGLFTVADFKKFEGLINSEGNSERQAYSCESNIVGLLAERLAWNITHHWLQSLSLEGKIARDSYEEDHIFANSGKYVLKIKNSPNMVLLEQTRHSKDGYLCIKEIDGLFLFENMESSYVIVQETKVNSLNVGLDYLMYDLFTPLREIFPGSRILYLVFSDMNSIYVGGHNFDNRKRNMNRIEKEPERIYESLRSQGIGTLFFGFRESGRPFDEMKHHILSHYDLMHKIPVSMAATVIPEKLILWFGDTPYMVLERSTENPEVWQEKRMKNR